MNKPGPQLLGIAFVAAALGLMLLIGLAGCSSAFTALRRTVPPKATVTAGSSSVTQSGAAQTPGSAKTQETTQQVTLPAGSWVAVNPTTNALEYRLSKDTPISTTVRTEQANAPQAFTPPAPPTVGEEKAAQADFWTVLGYRAGVLIGGAAAIYGMVHGWPMLMGGGAAVAGACLFGLFVKSHPALLLVIGGGIALKFVGPILWHTKLKPMELEPKPTP